jgi:hypothetical protein
MNKIREYILNFVAFISICILIWLMFSWWEIGMSSNIEQNTYSDYNAWVILTKMMT